MKARALAGTIGVGAAVLLAGCAPTVSLHPAPPHANDPHCADVMVQLPDTLDSQSGVLVQRETDAQSTSAWGDPTAVIFSCGVTVRRASSLPCVLIDTGDVYWLRQKDAAKGTWTFTTYGRDPAAQLTISTRLSPGVVLDQLGNQVSILPKTGDVCSSTEDTVTGEKLPDATPTPTP